MLNIIITGLPASGKRTQSEKLAKAFGLLHISTGDLLRHEADKATATGKKIAECLQNGILVSDDLSTAVVVNKVKTEINSAKGFVFDGFPRTPEQSDALDQLLESNGTSVSVFFVLKAEKEGISERMKLRGTAEDENAFSQLIEQQKSYLKVLEQHYQKQYKLNYVDGHGTPDEVFERLKNHVLELKGA